MTIKSTLALFAVIASVAFANSVAADQYASPNKYVAASSATGLNLFGGTKTSVDLTTSRKKKMLIVHASAMQDGGINGQTVSVSVKANGITLEPGVLWNACAKGICTVGGTFFLDMAQAEAAHPGVFYNSLPMNVEAAGGSTVTGGNGSLSLVAELLKK
jgi:hypothetical protein